MQTEENELEGAAGEEQAGQTQEGAASEESTGATDAAGDTGAEGTEGSDEAAGSDEEVKYQYQGQEVEIEIPDDLRTELSAKGLDVDALAKELYSNEKFEFSQETREKLEAAFGKTMVNAYMQGLKAQNELTMQAFKNASEAKQAADNAAWDAALTQVGGEETWGAMEAWAQNTFTDEEFSQFNKIMDSGDAYAQKLAINDVLSRYRKSEGDDGAHLVDGETAPPAGDGAGLSAQQYLNLFKTGEYYKDPAKYDALRRKGQAAGLR